MGVLFMISLLSHNYYIQNNLVISGFIKSLSPAHSRFYYYWLQPLSHFVVTNIRKFFQTSKYFFVNPIQALLRIPSEYYSHKILVV